MKTMIIKPGALGDTLMLMPAIAQLRALTDIFLVARNPGLYYIKPYVKEGINYEAHGWHLLFSKNPNETDMPHIPSIDTVAAFLSDPEGLAEKNLKTWLPNIPIHIFQAFPPTWENIHVSFHIARSLKTAGLPLDVENAIDAAHSHPLIGQGCGVFIQKQEIVLHPGSGGRKKNYAPEFWIKLIQAFKISRLNDNVPIILILGPAEEGLLSYFRASLDEKEVRIIFYPEKEVLASLLAQASLYIGHDSGVTHLAAMLGTRVIAFFIDSSIQQWRPLGPCVKVVRQGKGDGDMDFIGKILEYSQGW
jgi:heptosyltransferase-3